MEDQPDYIPAEQPHAKKPKREKPAKRVSWAPTVKWIAICLTMFMLTLILYQVYRVMTAPVRGISGAAEMVKESATSVGNRLDVQVKKPKSFSQLSEEAFKVLVDYPKQNPSFSQGLFYAQHLRGSNNQVCRFNIDFGDGDIPVFVAVNNTNYQTAKAVGSLEGRIIRAHLLTGGREIGLRSYYEDETKKWKMRWRRMTFNKPLNDSGAQNTMREVLSLVPKNCQIKPDNSSPSE